MDFRNNTLSASVRKGIMTREEAWDEYNKPPIIEKSLLEYFLKRLNLTSEQFEKTMSLPAKSWKDFPTYKKWFECLKPMFFVLAKSNLVPMSFYLKYCFADTAKNS